MPRLHVVNDDSASQAVPRTAKDVLKALQAPSSCLKGLYVHVPFCIHRCHYCDFFTIAGREQDRSRYVDRLIAEAECVLPQLPIGMESIFIGGGTPTYLSPDDLHRLLSRLRTLLQETGQSIAEWTVEANPDTVSEEIADVLGQSGVNRVSLGAQSFQPQALTALERHHDPDHVGLAMDRLRQAGISDLSLDLIFAVPSGLDPRVAWRADLEMAISLKPTHMSCYGLTYEPGTPLTRRLETGRVTRVSQEMEAAQYEEALTLLAQEGYEHYEISNWARPGCRCRHNEIYWRNENWWPLGPSASGHVEGTRWRNVPRLGEYLDSEGLPPIDSIEQLDEEGRWGEVLMLGLRLLDGVPKQTVDAACATSGRGARRADVMRQAIEDELLEWRKDHLALTTRGLLLADGVIRELL
ncbi:MAG: radical SAM family heme chaperone HemW [Phycisphaerales bacterium]|nr:radical SAM family heme chaperone HemW [Phycisphaerales bacterium]